MAERGSSRGRPIAAVERTVAVLEALAAAGGASLGTNELARRAGINASTVSRLLGTLAGAGLVTRDGESGRWRLGAGVLRLADAALAGLDVRALARPHLLALVAETGETATLSLPAGPEAVTADFVASPRSVSSRAQIGRASVAHATAVGRLVLAHEPALLDALPSRLERFTPATVTDAAELRRIVEAVRGAGWAEVAGEREDGLNAVAAPVHGHGGALVAVLGVQGPERFDAAARQAAVAPLLRAAGELSAALGARPS